MKCLSRFPASYPETEPAGTALNLVVDGGAIFSGGGTRHPVEFTRQDIGIDPSRIAALGLFR